MFAVLCCSVVTLRKIALKLLAHSTSHVDVLTYLLILAGIHIKLGTKYQ
jgi:hypothetical protein